VLQLIALLPTVDGQRVDVLGASDEAFAVKGGSAKLAEALASRLAGRVELGKRLERLEPAGAGYRLVFSPSALVEADFVIVALPLPPLRRVALEIEMPAKLSRFIAEVSPGTNEKHIAAFRRRAWRGSNAFSREAWTDLGFAEVWDSAGAEPEREAGALTFFVGGRETAGADIARFVAALDRFVPGLQAQATGRTLRTDWSNDPLTGGAYTNLKPGQMTALGDQFWTADHEVRAGRVYFAGEHLSEEFYGYMNGAAETGRLAAAAIVKRLTGV
jgi:monoamine oxidase